MKLVTNFLRFRSCVRAEWREKWCSGDCHGGIVRGNRREGSRVGEQFSVDFCLWAMRISARVISY